MKEYMFCREEGFYIIELPDDQVALDCVEVNPGTKRIERLNGCGNEVIVIYDVKNNH